MPSMGDGQGSRTSAMGSGFVPPVEVLMWKVLMEGFCRGKIKMNGSLKDAKGGI